MTLCEIYTRKGCLESINSKLLLQKVDIPYDEHIVGEDITEMEYEEIRDGILGDGKTDTPLIVLSNKVGCDVIDSFDGLRALINSKRY